MKIIIILKIGLCGRIIQFRVRPHKKRPYAAQYVVGLLIRVYVGYVATYPNNTVNKRIKN